MIRPSVLGRRLVVVAVSALALSACGTSSSAPTPKVDGAPAFSISVALSTVGCAGDGVCVAAGASSAGVGPGAVAQFATARGAWHRLATPSVTSAALSATSCSTSTCLIGGADSTGDLLWRFDAPSHSLVASAAPAGGAGIQSLDCVDALDCVALDTGSDGSPRISLSADGGTTWTDPVAVPLASGATQTSLACTSLFACDVAATTASGPVIVRTGDGGATWSTHAIPNANSIELARCAGQDCVALARGNNSAVLRSSDNGRTWRRVEAPVTATSISCASLHACALAGNASSNSATLAEWRVGQPVRAVSLRYVPTPLVAVACASTRCAAVGATTVLSFALGA